MARALVRVQMPVVGRPSSPFLREDQILPADLEREHAVADDRRDADALAAHATPRALHDKHHLTVERPHLPRRPAIPRRPDVLLALDDLQHAAVEDELRLFPHRRRQRRQPDAVARQKPDRQHVRRAQQTERPDRGNNSPTAPISGAHVNARHEPPS